MTHDSHSRSRATQGGPPSQDTDALRQSGMSKSMHDGVAVWCDCRSCEAEPYWADLALPEGEAQLDAEALRARQCRSE
jgi:hypothetical protein